MEHLCGGLDVLGQLEVSKPVAGMEDLWAAYDAHYAELSQAALATPKRRALVASRCLTRATKLVGHTLLSRKSAIDNAIDSRRALAQGVGGVWKALGPGSRS